MLTNIYLTIAIVLRCATKNARIFYGILMIIFPQSSVVTLFHTQKLCVFVFGVPFHLVKIANWFSFLNASFSVGLKICYGSILLSSLSSKNQVQKQFGCKLWFCLTSRRMIFYTGNQTFPIAMMSVFRTKLYMQHLCSFFWFLLTALSILRLTAVPLMSVGSQISVPPPSYKRLISKCSFY